MTEPYRIRSPETWAQARDDYLAGLDAEAVCRRYDLGLSAFRRRARRQGWRRIDQDDPAPGEEDLSIYDDVTSEDQVEMAYRRFIQALNRGQAVAAARWPEPAEKVHDVHSTFSSAHFPADSSGPPSRAERRRQLREARRRGPPQSLSASTTPPARPPDTTSPPAMA